MDPDTFTTQVGLSTGVVLDALTIVPFTGVGFLGKLDTGSCFGIGIGIFAPASLLLELVISTGIAGVIMTGGGDGGEKKVPIVSIMEAINFEKKSMLIC